MALQCSVNGQYGVTVWCNWSVWCYNVVYLVSVLLQSDVIGQCAATLWCNWSVWCYSVM